MSFGRKKIPSLVDLCIRTAIDNVRYLGDVGETDINLLKEVLPHCTVDQLMHIETSSKGRDLSPVTDKLWKRYYEQQFGPANAKEVIERMKQRKVSFKWSQLYKAKLKESEKVQQKSVDRLKQLYEKETVRKQSRQIQICTKVPPSKRGFWAGPGGSGSCSNFSSSKGNLMKKAKMDYLNSHEVKMQTTMKRTAIQRNQPVPRTMKPASFNGKDASSSRFTKPLPRRP